MMEEIPIGEVSDGGPEEEAALDGVGGDGGAGEKWAPIGGSVGGGEPGPSSPDLGSVSGGDSAERLRELEEEQEQLSASLFALTTHFAQVQFRLQQIVKTEGGEEKEALLKELEEFAFRGCPDINDVRSARSWHSNDPGTSNAAHDSFMERQREKQQRLIAQLKEQLQDLERFAYESGDAGLPTEEILQKQSVLIDQVRQGIHLDVDSLDHLSPEELQAKVDAALKRLVNPIKVKDQLVSQLKTQITDLERFIEFLQVEGGPQVPCSCKEGEPDSKETCFVHGRMARNRGKLGADAAGGSGRKRRDSIAAASDFLSLYILHYLGCQSRVKFRSNELKGTAKGNHWGDLRAALEMAVDSLIKVTKAHEATATQPTATLNPYASDEEDVDDVFEACAEEVVAAVRKELAPALRDLLGHGLVHAQPGLSASIGCFGARSRAARVAASESRPSGQLPGASKKAPPHPWDLLAAFYHMKHGREFSDAPVRKLTQSFGLDNVGGKSVSSKQLLLSTIDNIQSSHAKLRRSPDAMFKAWISAALNQKKLVAWLRMILRTREIVEEHYAAHSYVVRTGADDAFAVLESLNGLNFALPVDLAVRPFNHIRDAF